MEPICMRYQVTGKVQGVWFRDSTVKKARKIGVTGWVRNLPDGRVEILACGESHQLDLLQKWLHKGPLLAKVHGVDAEQVPFEVFSEFHLRS